jgi:hypothetical protein
MNKCIRFLTMYLPFCCIVLNKTILHEIVYIINSGLTNKVECLLLFYFLCENKKLKVREMSEEALTFLSTD